MQVFPRKNAETLIMEKKKTGHGAPFHAGENGQWMIFAL